MKDTCDRGAVPASAGWGTPAPITAAMFDGLASSSATAPGSRRPFVVAQILERCLGSRQLVDRVLSSFEQRFEAELDAVRGELVSGDVEALAKLSHRLKGACANAAAEELADLSSELEAAARAEQLDQARIICDGMPEAWSRFVAARKAFRSDRKVETTGTPD